MKRISIHACFLVLLVTLLMGCEENFTGPGFTPGKESTFRINQLYTSSDGLHTLIIKEISDSRCPEGVVCIWSGEVTVKGEWTENSTKSNFEIHSVFSEANKLPEGVAMRIVDAKPYPKYGTESKPADLVLTMIIEKN